jgi:hypothetical protein
MRAREQSSRHRRARICWPRVLQDLRALELRGLRLELTCRRGGQAQVEVNACTAAAAAAEQGPVRRCYYCSSLLSSY